MKNRFFLSTICIFILSIYTTAFSAFSPACEVSPSLISSSEATAAQPNIIFILTDDLDAASIEFMPKLQTLLIDQGTVFTNFFISMPLCCPSRAAILRGQYGHNTQILGNSLPSGGFEKFYQLNEEQSTVATWLQNAGYRTMLAGKYLNGFPLKKDLMHIPPGWTEWYSAVKGNAYSEYDYTLNENGRQVVYENDADDYGTDVYTRKTIEFIERSKKEGKPFFAYVSVYAPHGPATPAPRHADMFIDAVVPRSPNFNEADVSDKPSHIRNRPELTPAQIKSLDEDYRKRLQSLQAVDDMIESIIHALGANGLLDNTYIFFTSDNGFHLGNHRQLTGKVAPYEEEIRVSLIVRGPGVPAGRTLDHLTGNIDLAPTWAEIARAKAPDFVDGRSLVPLLNTTPPDTGAWRQCFGIENGLYQQKEPRTIQSTQSDSVLELLEPPDQDDNFITATPTPQRVALGIPDYRGLRTMNYSYIEYVTGEKELYDLNNDPFQLQNIAYSADKDLLKLFAARLKELQTCKAAGCHTIENKPIINLIANTPFLQIR